MSAWWLQAACRGMDPALFFPAKGDDESGADAKAVCGVCSVREECLTDAVVRCEREGICVRVARANAVEPSADSVTCRYCGRALTVRGFALKLRPRSSRRTVYAYVADDGTTECSTVRGTLTLHHPTLNTSGAPECPHGHPMPALGCTWCH